MLKRRSRHSDLNQLLTLLGCVVFVGIVLGSLVAMVR